jgi:hypothetical protein
MLDRLILAFSNPATPSKAKVGQAATSTRDIVRARSHGNIYLQRGEFYTKKDVDAKFERIRKVNFSD